MTVLCKVMQVPRSGYYQWLEQCCPIRQQMNKKLIPLVREIHKESKGTYGTRRIAKALRELNIPCGRVINHSDMGNDDVKKFAAKEDLTILMEIPFDRRIAEAYSKGRLIVEEMPEWKKKFLNLYSQIKKQVG